MNKCSNIHIIKMSKQILESKKNNLLKKDSKVKWEEAILKSRWIEALKIWKSWINKY